MPVIGVGRLPEKTGSSLLWWWVHTVLVLVWFIYFFKIQSCHFRSLRYLHCYQHLASCPLPYWISSGFTVGSQFSWRLRFWSYFCSSEISCFLALFSIGENAVSAMCNHRSGSRWIMLWLHSRAMCIVASWLRKSKQPSALWGTLLFGLELWGIWVILCPFCHSICNTSSAIGCALPALLPSSELVCCHHARCPGQP